MKKGIQILSDENNVKPTANYINFEVISSNCSNKIRLQQIFKLNEVYNATVLVNYCVEGDYDKKKIY